MDSPKKPWMSHQTCLTAAYRDKRKHEDDKLLQAAVINPLRMRSRVTVVCLFVCLSVCLSVPALAVLMLSRQVQA